MSQTKVSIRQPINKVNKTIPEIIHMLSDVNTDIKLVILNRYKTPALKWLVDLAYNSDIPKIYYCPEFNKPMFYSGYSISSIDKSLTRIKSAFSYLRKMELNTYDRLISIIYESVSIEEQELLDSLFSGKKFPNVSKSVWKSVYPDLFDKDSK